MCVSRIDVSDIFEDSGDVSRAMAALTASIRSCEAWRRAYNDTVEAISAHPGPRKRTWAAFDVASIFAHVEGFVQRCRDLLDVCEGVQQFSTKYAAGEPIRRRIWCEIVYVRIHSFIRTA